LFSLDVTRKMIWLWKHFQLYTRFINILLSLFNMFLLQMQIRWSLINLLIRLCGLMRNLMVMMFTFFYNCLLHAFKSMIQGFMPIRAYTTMQEDVGVWGIPESVFSKSVFWYCKVSLFPPNIDIVLFYGKYKDIDIDAQYQEIYLIQSYVIKSAP